jgi:hypothetical protein
MRRSLLIAPLLMAAACAVDSDDLDDPSVDDAELEEAIPVEGDEIARIALASGEVVFYTMPHDGGVAMFTRTIPDADGRMTVMTGDRSPLATYLALTRDDVPVPRALLDSAVEDADRERAERRVVTRSPVTAVGELTDDTPSVETSPATMCNQGTTSAAFANEICSLYGGYDVSFCHNGTWHSVTDGWSSTNVSRGITLACGANGKVRHYYKFGGIWYKPLDVNVPSGEMWESHIVGTTDLDRRITHSRTASGFVRGASWFDDL